MHAPAHPPPFAAFVAPARARPQLWRLVAGLAIIVAVHLALSAVLVMLLARAPGGPGALTPERIGTTPGVMAVLLFSFAGLVAGVWLAVRLLHRRSLGSVIGHAPTALRHFAFGAGLIVVLHGTALAVAAFWIDLRPGLAPGLWLAWLPLALVGLAIQTGAEELVFRGYLQQQLAARFASPVVWMVLPSVIFGLMHHEPAVMGPNTWLVVAVTGFFGLMAADLTARSGTLGLAWGLHFANNLFALLIVAPVGALSGLALFSTPFGPDDAGIMRLLLLADIGLLAVVWWGCRRALGRG